MKFGFLNSHHMMMVVSNFYKDLSLDGNVSWTRPKFVFWNLDPKISDALDPDLGPVVRLRVWVRPDPDP